MKNILKVLSDSANLAVFFGAAMLSVAIGGILVLQVLSLATYPISAQFAMAIFGFIVGYKVIKWRVA